MEGKIIMKIAEVKEVILDLYLSYSCHHPKGKQAIALKKVLSILEQIQKSAEKRGLDI